MSKDKQSSGSFFNVSELISVYLSKWKWILVSILVFMLLGVVVYKKQQPTSEIVAQVLISDEKSSATSSLGEIASMFGAGGSSFGSNRSIEDEMVIIKAHSLLTETVKELEMNVSYYVKKDFIKTEQVFTNPPVKLIYNTDVADTLSTQLTFDLSVDASGVAEVKVRNSKKKVVADISHETLPCTVETCYGNYTLVPGSTYEPHKKLTETIVLSSYEGAALGLSRAISVDYSAKKTDIMSINYVTPDPQHGKMLINKIVDNYNQLTIKQKQAFSAKTLEFLEERIRILASEVDSTQSQVESFMGRRDLVDPEAQVEIYLEQTATQEVELLKAESNYELLRMAMDFLSNEANKTSMLPIMPSIEALTPLIEGYNELILERLTIESSAKGSNLALKAINERINVLRDNLLVALNKQSESASFEIAELRRQFAKSKNKLKTMPGIGREYANIMRQQTLKEQLYVYLLRQREETEMAIAGAHPRGVIIDEAYQTDAMHYMSAMIIMAIFFVLGFVVPGVIITLYWMLSRKVHTVDQVVALSGYPLMATVPVSMDVEPVVTSDPESVEAKRIRLLRGNILSLDDCDKHSIIAVAGTSDSDASARIAVNLAVAMALSNRRVVLVEGDLFGPAVGPLLDMTSTAGLLTENLNSDNVSVQTISVGNGGETLDVITADADKAYGADKLASVKWTDLMKRLSDSYDIVIVSAPGVDAHFDSVESINSCATMLLASFALRDSSKGSIEKLAVLGQQGEHVGLVQIVANS